MKTVAIIQNYAVAFTTSSAKSVHSTFNGLWHISLLYEFQISIQQIVMLLRENLKPYSSSVNSSLRMDT